MQCTIDDCGIPQIPTMDFPRSGDRMNREVAGESEAGTGCSALHHGVDHDYCHCMEADADLQEQHIGMLRTTSNKVIITDGKTPVMLSQ